MTINTMSTHITGKNIELTPAIQQYIEQKIEAFSEVVEEIIAVDVEVDKNMHHKKGDVFHVRMNVQIPQHMIHSEEVRDDLYASIDVCRDEVLHQMRKVQKKYEAKKRKARNTRRSLKSVLSFWR